MFFHRITQWFWNANQQKTRVAHTQIKTKQSHLFWFKTTKRLANWNPLLILFMWNKASGAVLASALCNGFPQFSCFTYASTTSRKLSKAFEEDEHRQTLSLAVQTHVGPNPEHWPTFTKQPCRLGVVFERVKTGERALEITSSGGLSPIQNWSLTSYDLLHINPRVGV